MAKPARREFDNAKTPFPWFGGKTKAAPTVWEALGDVPHYVEPFFGGGAVLLRRPHQPNRTYFSETVNDADGLLVNFWRSVKFHPEAVADAASWPVSEADKHARACAVLREGALDLDRLSGDPFYCEPVLAGWWVWAVCCQIGGFGTGGPWWPNEEGVLVHWGRGVKVKGDPDRPGDVPGVGPGVKRNRPHLTNNGVGVNTAAMREPGVGPGVTRSLPHLSDDGVGVNTAAMREPGVGPGVKRNRPHLTDNGVGVNAPQLREPGAGPGVKRNLPHLSDDGLGVNAPQLREPGVGAFDPLDGSHGYHPQVMPRLTEWIAYLAARLRHVRILHGDWARTCTTGAAHNLPVRQGKGPAGVFLDPPYSAEDRASLYREESFTVANDVRDWCLKHGDNPKFRIVLAGYDTEHPQLVEAGWREVEWYKAGHLTGGYGNIKGAGKHQQKRERLWLSPHCLTVPQEQQQDAA